MSHFLFTASIIFFPFVIVASLCLLILHSNYPDEISSILRRFYEFILSNRLVKCSHEFTTELAICTLTLYAVYSLAILSCGPFFRFRLSNFDHQRFKSDAKCYLFSSWFFFFNCSLFLRNFSFFLFFITEKPRLS